MRCICLMIVVVIQVRVSFAQSNSPEIAESNRPDEVTVVVGDITTRIDGSKLWTLSGFEYQQKAVAVRDSAYGTVLNIRDVGFLGTAHFLDVPGKPGQIEKENVTMLRFFLDEQPVTQISRTMKLVGKLFRLERESTIRDVALNSTLTIEDGLLVESVRIRTENDVDLKLIYPLMYAWTPTASAYLFGDDDGIQRRDAFLSTPSKPAEGLEKSSRWMAIYDASHGIGAVCYVAQRPLKSDVWMQFTDAPGVYRKLRLMCFSDKTLPAGFDGTFQTSIDFFSAIEPQWETEALARMNKLKLLATQPASR